LWDFNQFKLSLTGILEDFNQLSFEITPPLNNYPNPGKGRQPEEERAAILPEGNHRQGMEGVNML